MQAKAVNMERAKKSIRVVGVAIIDSGHVLVAQRPYSDIAYKSLKWEFPGGKIEPGESEAEAARREILEELDCEIEVDALLPEIQHEYPDFNLCMTICIAHLLHGSVPKCCEHNAIAWLSASDLSADIDWAAADARCYQSVVTYLEGR